MATDLQPLGRAIKHAQYQHHRALDRALARVGTSLAQWDALRAIAANPGDSAHGLAVATFQSDQAFGTLAARLIAQSLIERRPGKGRRIEHHLTPAGEATLEAGHPVANEVFEQSFGGLTDDERSSLLNLLTRVGAAHASDHTNDHV